MVLDMLATGLLAAGTAVLAVLFLGRFARRTGNPQGHDDAVFLFRDGELRDANAAALAFLNDSDADLQGWAGFADRMQGIFPGFPGVQPPGLAPLQEYMARTSGREERVFVESHDATARVTYSATPTTAAPAGADVIPAGLDSAPYPIWHSMPDGGVDWANTAYLGLASRLGFPAGGRKPPRIFDMPASDEDVRRIEVTNRAGDQTHWFDVATVREDSGATHYAVDASAIVTAEIAQRNFVQTLTKTFATLSIGLAIFDRNRQLAMFNPALIDLTRLPADFLSARPNLQSFFDRMRENQMIPEPKDYVSWRAQIAELVVAASDGRYSETWSLPSGLTYRVSGRPHPDGAIAFLFEDISAEIGLTRRFRADLELGQSTLDALEDPIAVFTAVGTLALANSAYCTVWQTEPESGLVNHTIRDAVEDWTKVCGPQPEMKLILDFVLDPEMQRAPETTSLDLGIGEPVEVHLSRIHGGASLVRFATDVRTAETTADQAATACRGVAG